MESARSAVADDAATLPVSLLALPVGARAVIERLQQPADADDREVLLRLIELGFLPGETVRIVAKAHGGQGPVALRLGGQSTFALRAREAALIGVRHVEGPGA
jgi:ferrous iron transport protein A